MSSPPLTIASAPGNGIAKHVTTAGKVNLSSIAGVTAKNGPINQPKFSSFFPPPPPPPMQSPHHQRATMPLTFASQQFDTLLRSSETIVDDLRTKIDTARRRHFQMRDALTHLAQSNITAPQTVSSRSTTPDSGKNAQRYLHSLPKHVSDLISLLDESEEKIDNARAMLVEFLEQLDVELGSDDASTTITTTSSSGSTSSSILSRNSKDVSNEILNSDDSAIQVSPNNISCTPTNRSSMNKFFEKNGSGHQPTNPSSVLIRPLQPARVLLRPPLRSNVSVGGTMVKHDAAVEKSPFGAVIAEHMPRSASSNAANMFSEGNAALHRTPEVYDLVKELQLDETFAEFERQFKEMTTTSR